MEPARLAWVLGPGLYDRDGLKHAAHHPGLEVRMVGRDGVTGAQMALGVTNAPLRTLVQGQGMARWLLMSQDRAHADHFHVTHEFLAYMLGVRRVGITVAAGTLQRAGLIAYHRGEMQVLDRPGLEAAACSCYQSDRLAYAQWLA
jgi:hypothetical protein